MKNKPFNPTGDHSNTQPDGGITIHEWYRKDLTARKDGSRKG